MKIEIKYCLFLIILVSSSIIAQENQIYKVNYNKYFDIDEEKFYEYYSNVSNKDVVNRNKKTFTQIENYELICDNFESVFNLESKINNSQTEQNNFEDINGSKINFYDYSGLIIYKNLKKMFSLIPNDGKTYIQDSIYNFKWNTNFNEKDTILGVEVKKATCEGLEPNTKIIAWYAPNIPYSNGPYIYGGLPGLILKLDILVYSNMGIGSFINSYHFEAIELLKLSDNKELYFKPKEKYIIKLDDYNKKMDDFKEKQKDYNNQGVDVD